VICPHEKIKDLYNQKLPELAAVAKMTDQRKKSLLARWRESTDYQSLEWWEKYFEYVSGSDFLMGRKTGFQANFDFLITAGKFIKIIEGFYHRENAS
jgi:hypothetical protein